MKTCDKCGSCYDDAFDLCAVDGTLLLVAFAGARVVGGRYRLEQRLDSGSMGTVYRAVHQDVGSAVAVKVINPEWSGNALIEARFRREAQLLGQIKHPNAVLVIDFGVDERGMLYLVTEFLRGEPLSHRIHKKALTLEEVERLITPLCEAVEEAHRVGIVHRDIKASNVFLERLRDGSEIVKVLDFGIAKLVERPAGEGSLEPHIRFDDVTDGKDGSTNPELPAALMPQLREDATIPDMEAAWAPASLGLPVRVPDLSELTPPPPLPRSDPLTLQGRVIGTITYMAPEQLEGSVVSPQTDVYAIASLVFRLLAGQLPFTGNELQIAVRKLEGSRPSLRDAGVDVPIELDRFLQTAFARTPSDRPSSVLDLAHVVRSAAAKVRKRRAAPADEQGLVAQVTAFVELLDELVQALADELVGYEAIRDRILALDAPLSRLRFVSTLADRALAPRDRPALGQALAALDEGLKGTGHALRGISTRYDYLATLGLRLLKSAHELSRALHLAMKVLDVPSDMVRPDPSALFDTPGDATPATGTLEECISALNAKDALLAEEGLEQLLSGHLESAVARLGAHGLDLHAEDLLRGLWRQADELMLRDLYPSSTGAFRLVPFLAKLKHRSAARPFAVLSRAFRQRDQVGELGSAELRMLWRCLVLSPTEALRAEALAQVTPGELWTIIAFPRTPLSLQRQIFERVHDAVAPEYLQVYFLCVRDALAAAAGRATPQAHEDLLHAFALVARLFDLPSFHEDFVFEPLVELEAELRRAADAVDVEPPGGDRYRAALEIFRGQGPQASAPIESLRDVPLPVQRKLARGGYFLAYFVCHPNERVAMETVPHLLKREEVVSILKLAKIHRSVLLQLVREERFFRKEEARLALLSNPKTPAFVARKFLPFLARAQLKLLAQSKQISAEVRQLAAQYLKKLPPSSSASS